MKWRLGNCSSRTIYGLWICCRHNRHPKCMGTARDSETERARWSDVRESVRDRKYFATTVKWMKRILNMRCARAHIIRSHPSEMPRCLAWCISAMAMRNNRQLVIKFTPELRISCVHRIVYGLSMGTRIIWNSQFFMLECLCWLRMLASSNMHGHRSRWFMDWRENRIV